MLHIYGLARRDKGSGLDERVIGLVCGHIEKPPDKSVPFSLVGNSHICISGSDVLVEQIPNLDLFGCSECSILFDSFNRCLSSLGGGGCICGGV